MRNGGIVYHQQFGRMWIDPVTPGKFKPANEQTMYRIASVSTYHHAGRDEVERGR